MNYCIIDEFYLNGDELNVPSDMYLNGDELNVVVMNYWRQLLYRRELCYLKLFVLLTRLYVQLVFAY